MAIPPGWRSQRSVNAMHSCPGIQSFTAHPAPKNSSATATMLAHWPGHAASLHSFTDNHWHHSCLIPTCYYLYMNKPLRVYSDVVGSGMILPRKKKYTIRDCERVIVDSLFSGGQTLSRQEAAFVVKCSAAFHGTDCSKSVGRFGNGTLGITTA